MPLFFVREATLTADQAEQLKALRNDVVIYRGETAPIQADATYALQQRLDGIERCVVNRDYPEPSTETIQFLLGAVRALLAKRD